MEGATRGMPRVDLLTGVDDAMTNVDLGPSAREVQVHLLDTVDEADNDVERGSRLDQSITSNSESLCRGSETHLEQLRSWNDLPEVILVMVAVPDIMPGHFLCDVETGCTHAYTLQFD